MADYRAAGSSKEESSTDISSSFHRYVDIYISRPLRFLANGGVAIGSFIRNVFGRKEVFREFDPFASSENFSDVIVVSDLVRDMAERIHNRHCYANSLDPASSMYLYNTLFDLCEVNICADQLSFHLAIDLLCRENLAVIATNENGGKVVRLIAHSNVPSQPEPSQLTLLGLRSSVAKMEYDSEKLMNTIRTQHKAIVTCFAISQWSNDGTFKCTDLKEPTDIQKADFFELCKRFTQTLYDCISSRCRRSVADLMRDDPDVNKRKAIRMVKALKIWEQSYAAKEVALDRMYTFIGILERQESNKQVLDMYKAVKESVQRFKSSGVTAASVDDSIGDVQELMNESIEIDGVVSVPIGDPYGIADDSEIERTIRDICLTTPRSAATVPSVPRTSDECSSSSSSAVESTLSRDISTSNCNFRPIVSAKAVVESESRPGSNSKVYAALMSTSSLRRLQHPAPSCSGAQPMPPSNAGRSHLAHCTRAAPMKDPCMASAPSLIAHPIFRPLVTSSELDSTAVSSSSGYDQHDNDNGRKLPSSVDTDKSDTCRLIKEPALS